MFLLRFPLDEIRHYSTLYDYEGDVELLAGPARSARERGFLTHAELVAIGDWKSPRNRARYRASDSEFVEEITRLALAPTTSDRLAIEALTLLSGVEWPTASVILHLCHSRPFPILDFRALWSLTVPVPPRYSFPFWQAYTRATRTLAADAQVDMRTLDRALWAYSARHQPAA